MRSPMTFDQLCSLFVRGLVDKAHASASRDLDKAQLLRLGESVTTDLRQLSDMVFPAARTPRVSVAADKLAASVGVDLRTHTWHSNKRLDLHRLFTYEHVYPVSGIRLALTATPTETSAMDLLDQMLWVAWITKEEAAHLSLIDSSGLGADPLVVWDRAGIHLVPDATTTHAVHLPDPATGPRVCEVCGQAARSQAPVSHTAW